MRKSNRGLVQNFMPGLQKAFSSANKALNFLKSQGLSYRTQDFYNDWRSYAGYEKQKDNWKKTTYAHKISEKYFRPTEAKYKKKYIYHVGVNGWSDVFGEVKNKVITVVSNTNMTVGNVINEAKRAVNIGHSGGMISFRKGYIKDIEMAAV